jgi:hypothetical protein
MRPPRVDSVWPTQSNRKSRLARSGAEPFAATPCVEMRAAVPRPPPSRTEHAPRDHDGRSPRGVPPASPLGRPAWCESGNPRSWRPRPRPDSTPRDPPARDTATTSGPIHGAQRSQALAALRRRPGRDRLGEPSWWFPVPHATTVRAHAVPCRDQVRPPRIRAEQVAAGGDWSAPSPYSASAPASPTSRGHRSEATPRSSCATDGPSPAGRGRQPARVLAVP